MTKPSHPAPRNMKPSRRFTWAVRYEQLFSGKDTCCICIQRTTEQQRWQVNRCIDTDTLTTCFNPRLHLAWMIRGMREEIRYYIGELRKREALTR